MAHALKRVSYASCTPEHHQFAFVAREPRRASNKHVMVAQGGEQYCHVYRAKSQQQVR